jgi:signal transduction histidine kinase
VRLYWGDETCLVGSHTAALDKEAMRIKRIVFSDLGLAICRRIVQEHNGTFDLVSEGIPGKGTRVYLTLPVSDNSTVDYLCE